ncbi:MAG: hypothetical protein QOG85_1945 [Gaiellaceae bacterium]|jgi:hypothetical protein|nr:hypothetical protein [Gaiellaceae bacterium]
METVPAPGGRDSFSPVGTRIPEEWRVPIAFVALWVVSLLVADSLLLLSHGRDVLVAVAFSLLLTIALANALLQRSRVVWWLLVVLSVGGMAEHVFHLVKHGLSVHWALWSVLELISFALLISAPMRRFVRLRGPLAPGPR